MQLVQSGAPTVEPMPNHYFDNSTGGHIFDKTALFVLLYYLECFYDGISYSPISGYVTSCYTILLLFQVQVHSTVVFISQDLTDFYHM